jgi:hypothetical protein
MDNKIAAAGRLSILIWLFPASRINNPQCVWPTCLTDQTVHAPIAIAFWTREDAIPMKTVWMVGNDGVKKAGSFTGQIVRDGSRSLNDL